VGHYLIGKTVGQGTFGSVKLGTHIHTGEAVAVKVLDKSRIKEIAGKINTIANVLVFLRDRLDFGDRAWLARNWRNCGS
jgi:5'-AMP-activated protein kinase catalytic alpha subunit/MAP/microtubule affinity-regulating kinase